MKALLRVLKNEKYATLLLLCLVIFNSAIVYKVAAKYTPSAGASNLVTIVPAEITGGVPEIHGVLGNFVGQFNNGILTSKGYTTTLTECKTANLTCDTLEDLSYLDTINPPGFSSVNALADANITLLNQRSASAVDYVQDKVYALTHFGVVSAQTTDIPSREAYYSPGGTGFQLLRPIQNFWSWSVRVVYGFLIIIVILIAFAIMFRQRLSGNVEVTVQNAIPAIAMAMILVPLSYAISGLFIDVITVGTNAVHEFLIGTSGSPGYSLYSNSATTLYTDPLDRTKTYPDRGYYPDDIRVDWLRARDNLNVSKAFGDIANDVGDVSGLKGNVIFLGIGSIVNAITGNTTKSAQDFAWVGDIVQFIVSIVTLWIGVQVFVALFKKYIVMIFMPVMSPFIFATVAIPGNGTKSIMTYIKVMMAAALAYIVTYAMFLLSAIFTSQAFIKDVPSFASASFNPPLIGLRNIGIGSNEITELVLTLIGLGIYFSIPSTLKSIDKALGADQPIPKFITTPIDSFKESQRVMFKQVPAGILATGAGVVGGIRGGAKGIANVRTGIDNAKLLPSKARGMARQPFMTYQNWRKGGLKPGEAGSGELDEAKRISNEIKVKEAERKDAINKGDGAKARRLAGEIKALNAQAEAAGVQSFLASSIKDEDKMKLNVTFKGNSSSDGEFVFRNANVDALVAPTVPLALNVASGGKLVFEVVGNNNVLPADIKVEVFQAVPDGNGGMKANGATPIDTLLSTAPIGGRGGQVFGEFISAATKTNINTIAQLVCTSSATDYKSADNKKFEIKFDLKLDAKTVMGGKKLFGDPTTSNNYVGGWVDANTNGKLVDPSTLGTTYVVDSYIFKIGDLSSDPVKVALKYVP